MSRIGKRIIVVPEGVTVKEENGIVYDRRGYGVRPYCGR